MWEIALLILAMLGAAFWVVALPAWFFGIRSMRHLREVGREYGPERYPRLSVIVPARDEARGIEAAMQSLLAQDYPDLEIVAVDDRSTDGTAGILDRLAAEHPALRVLRVSELPEGWLGKNYALQRGYELSTGEWLLFTDADIEFAPECLRYAVGYAVGYAAGAGRDHLTLVPEIVTRGPLIRGLISAFHMLFSLFSRPWAASDPDSRAYVGVGAFNLVRREAYEAVGTHHRIPLRPDDDLKLAKLMKRSGFRQECLFALDLLKVEWYANIGEAIKGMEKSVFAGMDYRVGPVVASGLLLFVTNVFPFIGVFLATGVAQALFALSLLLLLVVYLYHARLTGTPAYYVLLHPVSASFFIYITVHSTYRALNGGVRWRGTTYPLETLKKNRV